MKSGILKSIAVFLFVLGIIGWFLPAIGWPFGSGVESPNSEPYGIVLDKYGNIYCGSKSCGGRIQKYYPDGRFACGFNTGGGTGRGTDFGFQINEKNQVCVTVLGVSKRRLRVYDTEGKLIRTEISDSNGQDYVPKARESANDSAGNVYTFRGFLFPRVIKQTPAGKKLIIVRTSLLLWFIQSPFPALVFIFVPGFAFKKSGLKTKVAKLSNPAIGTLINKKNLPSTKKIIFFCIGVLGIVVLLSILIPAGLKSYPLLVIFGFLSFVITVAIIFLLIFVSAIINHWRCAKLDFKAWKDSIFGSSAKIRYEAMMSLRSINDPLINKTGTFLNKVGLFCFLAWFVILVMVVCIVLYLDHIGVWSDLISKYSPK
jgi:hypothetical protein